MYIIHRYLPQSFDEWKIGLPNIPRTWNRECNQSFRKVENWITQIIYQELGPNLHNIVNVINLLEKQKIGLHTQIIFQGLGANLGT